MQDHPIATPPAASALGLEPLPLPAAAEEKSLRQKLFDFAVVLGLVVSILMVYGQVIDFDFVNYDDPLYVSQNAHVLGGLTQESLRAAFLSRVSNNWAPLTLLSHALDAQLFGAQSSWHHLVNVVFHILSACLLYASLVRAKLARAPSAFVTFVFALHPLHVESVAWISERKDVLSTFFWFLALYAYLRYAERPGWTRYLPVAAAFSLGLLAKAMLVTFPFTLLLLDVWPLRRAQWPKTLWEKWPLFAIAIAGSAVTYWAQQGTGAVSDMSFGTRFANGILSYVLYIGQTFWPVRLACFYPFPASINLWKVVASATLLVCVSAYAIGVRKTHPYIGVGWFWYLGTLVPVIGFVQVGMQAHADRYMYVPMIGLSLMLAFAAADAAAKAPWAARAVAAVGVVLCLACLLVARTETAYWRDSGTLFEHALASTRDNEIAENNIGTYMIGVGRTFDAVGHFESAVRINPGDANAQSNLGAALVDVDGCPAGVPHLEAALRISPLRAHTNFDLGVCLLRDRNYVSAATYLENAVRLEPNDFEAHRALGSTLSELPGRAPDAIAQYQAALRLKPDHGSTHARLGELLAAAGRTGDAIAHLETAQSLDPNPATAKLLQSLRAAPNN